MMGMIPGKDLQHSVTPFTDAAVMIWGSNARYWVSAGIAVAAFGALNGWILVQGQIPWAIAKDHLFPTCFRKENKKGVPATGHGVSAASSVSLLMYMNYTRGLVEQFKFLILLTTLSVLVPYLFSAASYLIIRLENKYWMPGNGWTAHCTCITGFFFSFWAIVGSGQDIVYWGFILLMLGVPFYVWTIWKKNS